MGKTLRLFNDSAFGLGQAATPELFTIRKPPPLNGPLAQKPSIRFKPPSHRRYIDILAAIGCVITG